MKTKFLIGVFAFLMALGFTACDDSSSADDNSGMQTPTQPNGGNDNTLPGNVCGAKPEPGLKPYTRFYQYTYVAIYRQMQAERLKAQEPQNDLADLSFEPVAAEKPFSLKRPLKRPHSAAMERILHGLSQEPPPPAPQPEKTPHGTIFLAYLKKKQYLCSPK